tara:strand:+ start:75 stop:2084 length:2010 start_codon:yes stop_codon:yes gene_type:complete
MIYLVTNQKNLFSHITADISFASCQELKDYFKDKDEVEFDTETNGFDPWVCKLISAQFGDANNQFVVDTATVDIREFKELLETKLILMQNAKFDLRFLYHHRIIPTKVYDTFLAESVLNMGRRQVRKSLDKLVARYCKQTMSKEVRGLIHKEGLSVQVIKYAAGDVKYLGDIKKLQIEKLKELSLLPALALDNKFVRVLAYIEYCGFKLDANKWATKMKEDNQLVLSCEEKLNKWVIDNNKTDYIDSQLNLFSDEVVCKINWNSEKQVIPLFKELGVNTKTKDKDTGKMKDSVDARVLQTEVKKHEMVPLYMEYKKVGKLVSSFGESVLKQVHSVTSRIHTTYKQILDTGRMSCGGKNRSTKPPTEYVNLQQIPRDSRHRECFISEEGYTLIVADYAGQESVVFANKCKDKDILKFYQEGLGDMHSFVASKIYPELEGLELDRIKKDFKRERQNAKAAGFAIQYGGVGATISNNLGLPVEEGDKIYDAYFKAFPGVKSYFVTCKADALAKGYILLNNVSNRKSFIEFFDDYLNLKQRIDAPGFWDEYKSHKRVNSVKFITEYKPLVRDYFKKKGMVERKSLNYPVQGTSAEITKFGGLLFFNYLEENGLLFKHVRICNIIHDEIVVECKKDIARKIAGVLKECMEKAGEPFCPTIPLKAEPCITEFWNH